MALLGLRYDLRIPDWAPITASGQYAACLEQCRWADNLGFAIVAISEHHGTDDGYLPAPIPLATAIAASTSCVVINIAAALIPLHDPVRFAEQLVVADLVAEGRISVVLGSGYRDEEFAMAGISFRDRLTLLEEYVGVVRQAFTGEYFEWQGRRIRVTPKPHTPGGPFLLMGGSSEAAMRRAARLHLGVAAGDNNPQLAEWYQDECDKIGFTEGFCSVPAPLGFVHISEDPERDWARIGRHALHDANSYGGWQRPGQHSAISVDRRETIDDLRASPVYRVITPDEAVAMYRESGSLLLHPLMGGLPPELGWESLQLFADRVLPVIQPS